MSELSELLESYLAWTVCTPSWSGKGIDKAPDRFEAKAHWPPPPPLLFSIAGSPVIDLETGQCRVCNSLKQREEGCKCGRCRQPRMICHTIAIAPKRLVPDFSPINVSITGTVRASVIWTTIIYEWPGKLKGLVVSIWPRSPQIPRGHMVILLEHKHTTHELVHNHAREQD